MGRKEMEEKGIEENGVDGKGREGKENKWNGMEGKWIQMTRK